VEKDEFERQLDARAAERKARNNKMARDDDHRREQEEADKIAWRRLRDEVIFPTLEEIAAALTKRGQMAEAFPTDDAGGESTSLALKAVYGAPTLQFSRRIHASVSYHAWAEQQKTIPLPKVQDVLRFEQVTSGLVRDIAMSFLEKVIP